MDTDQVMDFDGSRKVGSHSDAKGCQAFFPR